MKHKKWPQIHPMGLDGLLVRFADSLTEASNRAAIAFYLSVQEAQWSSIQELSVSLASVYVRFDPINTAYDDVCRQVKTCLAVKDWYVQPLPKCRRLWQVPTSFEGQDAPQLEEAAALAGLTPKQAIESIVKAPVRVQALGFAPGMPYLGELEACWAIPRQTALTPKVPAGGLCVAIRQLVLFPVASSTGWRHIARTHLPLFCPQRTPAFLLQPGDEIQFEPVSSQQLAAYARLDLGGAHSREIQ